MRQRTRIVVGVVLGCVAMTALAAALSRSSPGVGGMQSATSAHLRAAPPPPASQEESGASEQPEDVLVWIETEPPGAAIVRVKDHFVLGVTPETIAIRRSRESVAVRLELNGYRSETRDVAAARDGTLSVPLRPRDGR
jgi:hypothetical protein